MKRAVARWVLRWSRPGGQASLLRPLLYTAAAARHPRSVLRLLNAPQQGLLAAFLAARPELWTLLRVRFISTDWSPARRIAEVADHCRLAERLGRPFDLRPHEAATLLTLDEIAPALRVVLDAPRWMMREGLLSLSLFEGEERLFTLAFTLVDRGGARIAHAGGVQGRRGEDMLDRYRQLTRDACGLRPADLLFELFRMVAQHAGATLIRGVSTGRHPPNRAADGTLSPITFDYDRFWEERGGIPRPDGFFDLDVVPALRPASEVPARKRAQRRRRLEMMAGIGARMAAALAKPAAIHVYAREPAAG